MKFTLEDEGDINSYLGINIARPTKDTIKMNQPALAKRIIESLSLKDQRAHDAPAEPNVTLAKDLDGPDRKDKFHYRSLLQSIKISGV